MPALRVPCDARMSRRDAELAALSRRIPNSPAHPVLLGEPERGLKVNPNTKPTHSIYRHSGMPLAGIHSLNLFLDTGLRRYDGIMVRVYDIAYQLPHRFYFVVDLITPFVLSSTGSLERKCARTA